MDSRVYQTQVWLNDTYGGNSSFVKVDEDGFTGTKTMKALIRAMQIELSVTVDGVWGDSTSAAFNTLSINSDSSNQSIKNQIYIVQGGCYCKGYDPDGFNGCFSEGLSNAVISLKKDAGLATPTGEADAMYMKALLNTDGYVLASDGDLEIRTIQQALNNDYHAYIGLIPCNGIYEKSTVRGLISGLQVEQKKEYSNNVVDGIWGDKTMQRCPTLQRHGTVTNKKYVYLLQYALYVNGYDPNGFDGGFGAGVQSAVKKFQSFSGLTSDGIVGRSTWASLMVSYGDTSRKGVACDCMKPLTSAKAAELVSDGRTIVARYICGGANKKLTISELKTIYNAGLRVVPIFQLTHNYANYFNEEKGARDAYMAYSNLLGLQFPAGTTVYVSVDFDASISEVKEYIIPYFKEFKKTFESIDGNTYKIGIYAPRYVCTLVKNAGYTTSSFVCDMSSGFACNIGYPLPTDWAFDQISTLTLGSGDSEIEIDNDISSGRNVGVSFLPDDSTNYNDNQKYLNRLGRTFEIISSLNMPFDVPASQFTFEQEYTLMPGPPIEVTLVASTQLSTITDSVYSVNVVNGSLQDTSFTAEIENIYSEYNFDEVKDSKTYIPNFKTLALKIGNGNIYVGISSTGSKLSMYVEATVVESNDYVIDKNFSVTVKYTMDLNNDAPEELGQTAWDEFKVFAQEHAYVPTWDLDIASSGIISIFLSVAQVVFVSSLVILILLVLA